METIIEKSAVLSKVENVLKNPNLLDQPRSVLLFHVFKLTRILLPDIANVYWEQLLGISKQLPIIYKNEFDELKKSYKPAKSRKHGKFYTEILQSIEEAKLKKENEPAVSKEILLDCRLKIKKRWWSFGNSSLWLILIPALFEIDRQEALTLVRKLPRKIRQDQIVRWNSETPLTIMEWDFLHKILKNGLTDIFEEILDGNELNLNISDKMIEDLGSKLINKIHYINTTDTSENALTQAEAVRENSLNRFKSLINYIYEKYPDQASVLLESLCYQILTNEFYETVTSWANRMTEIRNILNYWKSITDQPDKVTAFIKNKTPKHLKGFVLAHWLAITSSSDKDVEEAFEALVNEPVDQLGCQAWFLIILINQERGLLAYNLSKKSINSNELTPRIVREWILNNSHEVLKYIPYESLPKDIISHFLLLQSTEEQLELLREKTNNGKDALPTEMWRIPDFDNLYKVMENPGFLPLDSEEHLFTTFFFTSEKNENQLNAYIKQYGFGQYSYSEIDKIILKVLHLWDVTYPEEARNLFNKMWSGFIPPRDIIQVDVLRNSLFERYRTIFSAHPESLQKLFISWIQREFVDKSMQWVIGQTTYTFSLKNVAAFIFSLQSARSIAVISSQKCDQILIDAIKSHLSDADLMNSAARLYISDKETMNIDPPSPLRSKYLLKDWQLGIIEASLKKITNSLITEINETVQV